MTWGRLIMGSGAQNATTPSHRAYCAIGAASLVSVRRKPYVAGAFRRIVFTATDPRSDTPRMPLIETEEAARRLARAIASDLSLYNEEKIVGGIVNDNLFEAIAEEIEEGRALFKRRVSPDLYPRNFYDRALVDILIKAKGHIKSKIW